LRVVFLQQKRSLALWTCLRDGLVPKNHIAFRIFRTAVESLAPLGLLYDDLALAPGARARHSRQLALYILTNGISRTSCLLTVRSLSNGKLRSTFRTFLFKQDRCCGDRAGLSDPARSLAGRIG